LGGLCVFFLKRKKDTAFGIKRLFDKAAVRDINLSVMPSACVVYFKWLKGVSLLFLFLFFFCFPGGHPLSHGRGATLHSVSLSLSLSPSRPLMKSFFWLFVES
jgi:hypothetical protein